MQSKTLLFGVIGTALVIGLAFFGQKIIFSAPAADRGRSNSPAPRDHFVAKSAKSAPQSTSERGGVAEDTETQIPVLTVRDPGSLERFDEEEWVPVKAGATLRVTDRVRTIDQGVTTIETADGSRIELVDEVEISVETLTRSLAELELHRGRLRAELTDSSDLALRVQSSGATAEAESGAFVIYADGDGMVAVASETAKVKLIAQDREVIVASGQQALVQPDQPPSDPESIPEEVFLRVAWPQQRTQKQRRLVVRGEVEPGTEVRVGSQRTKVSSTGAFEARLELDAGPNTVVVQATDPSGRTKQMESPQVTVRNRQLQLEVVNQPSWNQSSERPQ